MLSGGDHDEAGLKMTRARMITCSASCHYNPHHYHGRRHHTASEVGNELIFLAFDANYSDDGTVLLPGDAWLLLLTRISSCFVRSFLLGQLKLDDGDASG